ncbi:MAG: hypothetical protein MI892_10270, partial [Desulfobacterales bacterium]|nr:hypothetical protein [Desulfobacterales bacterium]
KVNNCTIADNVTGSNGSGFAITDSEVLITNSILWQNGVEDIRVLSGDDPNVMYCTISSGFAGVGNIITDPLFAQHGFWGKYGDPNRSILPSEPGAKWIPGDYHLQSSNGRWDPIQGEWITDEANSPAIDAAAPNATFNLEPKPNGDRRNQGTYGGTDQASMSTGD